MPYHTPFHIKTLTESWVKQLLFTTELWPSFPLLYHRLLGWQSSTPKALLLPGNPYVPSLPSLTCGDTNRQQLCKEKQHGKYRYLGQVQPPGIIKINVRSMEYELALKLQIPEVKGMASEYRSLVPKTNSQKYIIRELIHSSLSIMCLIWYLDMGLLNKSNRFRRNKVSKVSW